MKAGSKYCTQWLRDCPEIIKMLLYTYGLRRETAVYLVITITLSELRVTHIEEATRNEVPYEYAFL